MSDIVHGTYGDDVPIELDKSTGILKMAGKQGVLMRVRLINRLFGSIMDVRFFSSLLRTAGSTMGEDYVLNWLLENAKGELPAELRNKGEEFQKLLDGAEQYSMEPGRITPERQEKMHQYAVGLNALSSETRELLLKWLSTLPSARVGSLWQKMHDEDVYAGWGRSELTNFDRDQSQAQIQVTSSFIARLSYYWDMQGHAGQRVCSFLEGYFLGEAQVVFGRADLGCLERTCRMQGADKCTFLIGPESWLHWE